MVRNFRKNSLKFDGTNYGYWKEKIKTHFLCIGLGYWLITKNKKEVIEEENI